MEDITKCGRQQVGWICDPDGMMTPDGRDRAEAVLQTIEAECHHTCLGEQVGYQVAVAVVRRFEQKDWSENRLISAKAFATAVGNRWGVGHARCSDGILLFISLDDRVAYLRTAAGVRDVVSDDTAEIIISNMGPYFKEGKVDEGTVGGLLLLKDVLSGKDIRSWWERFGVFLFLAVVASIFLWPWFWCLSIGLFNCVALPIALGADCVVAGWRRLRGSPDPSDAVRDTLRRIQREVEGMEKGQQYDQLMCPICLEDVPGSASDTSKGDVGSATAPLLETVAQHLPCGHRFHTLCLQQWVDASAAPTCPLCREVIDTAALEEGQTEGEKTYKARLRYYITRLYSRQPCRTTVMRATLDSDVRHLYQHRYTDWYYWSSARTPLFVPAPRSFVDALPSFTDALEHSRQMSASYNSSRGDGGGSTGGGSHSHFGGGGFGSGGGGGGGSW
eukprot:GGOE01020180.1.p1 GENE.GGOE01020180.1~~GGOE01020180.1.p1  ORF type:complete len:484 (-),score=147.55 GGOE01020180.1:329-1666(-)